MNFLAHLYLSGINDDWRLGGFIADAVKGDKIFKYSEAVRQGIILHRKIDEFTDNHPVFKFSVERLKPKYKRYSSVITDMFYDHFLSVNWDKYSNEKLLEFAQHFYIHLTKNYLILPPRFRMAVPFLIYNNWLISYGSIEGLKKRLEGMSRRTAFYSGMNYAIEELQEHYPSFQDEFLVFFDDVIPFADIEKKKFK